MGKGTSTYVRATALIRDLDAVWDEISEDAGQFYRAVVFGSARVKPHHRAYKRAKWLGGELAINQIDVVSGGGAAGLMEAVCEGATAAETDARSIGCTMPFPQQSDSKRIHKLWESWDWGTRLRLFGTFGTVFVCLKFGIGTLLELFMIAQQLQMLRKGYSSAHKGLYMQNYAVRHGFVPRLILVGPHYALLIKLLKRMSVVMKTMSSPADFEIFEFARDEREALAMVLDDRVKWREVLRSSGVEPKN